MTTPIPITKQIEALYVAVIGIGLLHDELRAKDWKPRDIADLHDGLTAATKTLEWLKRNEAKIKAKISERTEQND